MCNDFEIVIFQLGQETFSKMQYAMYKIINSEYQ